MVRYARRIVPLHLGGKPPRLLLVGEAPGPRGANRTGIPFWGDDSGLALYGLLGELGLLDRPLVPWKRGQDISGSRPPRGAYAVTNACPQMPLGPDGRFCAPEPARLVREAVRLAAEIEQVHPQAVLACGKAAAFTLAQASRELGVEPPAPLAGSLAALKLGQAMDALADPRHRWVLAGARALVTTHPARGQWSPVTASGQRHQRVVRQLRKTVARGQGLVDPDSDP